MTKHLIALLTALIVSSACLAQSQSGAQSWECALDLHQGDTGTLSLERSNESVQGLIRFSRNDSVFESEVRGDWRGNSINLTRLLGADSSESMTGIAVALGTRKVNIGGRYSADYQGVWSADCDLISQSNLADEEPEQEGAGVQPSISAQVSPNSPNNQNRITFAALASHPDGIEKVTFFLGGEEIHTCNTAECETTHGPLATGIYSWRVEAFSNSGVVSVEDSNQLAVQDSQRASSCSVSGRAIGPSGPLADIYLVKLYGPNNTALLNATAGFAGGRYQFSNLPAGEYQLLVDTRGDGAVLASPANTIINCQSQATVTQDIDFR